MLVKQLHFTKEPCLFFYAKIFSPYSIAKVLRLYGFQLCWLATCRLQVKRKKTNASQPLWLGGALLYVL